MALVDCPECQARISDRAVACPQCGNPIQTARMPAAAVATLNGGVLDEAIGDYLGLGYRVASRTDTTALLVRPKVFSFFWALLWFLVFGVGVLVYGMYYLSKRDIEVYLSIGSDGELQERTNQPPRMTSGTGDWRTALVIVAVVAVACVAWVVFR